MQRRKIDGNTVVGCGDGTLKSTRATAPQNYLAVLRPKIWFPFFGV